MIVELLVARLEPSELLFVRELPQTVEVAPGHCERHRADDLARVRLQLLLGEADVLLANGLAQLQELVHGDLRVAELLTTRFRRQTMTTDVQKSLVFAVNIAANRLLQQNQERFRQYLRMRWL